MVHEDGAFDEDGVGVHRFQQFVFRQGGVGEAEVLVGGFAGAQQGSRVFAKNPIFSIT